jgi:hypothetical protein
MWIVDDFLPDSLYNDLKNLVLGDQINWNYMPGGTSVDIKDEFYFVHKVIAKEHTSPIFNDIKPVLYFMDDKLGFVIDNLMRINCTLCTNQGKRTPQTMHVDFDEPHYTGIYYINTNNGPTIVEDTKVDSVANRFVLFDGLKKHAATIQDDTFVRANIVFNMKGHFRQK